MRQSWLILLAVVCAGLLAGPVRADVTFPARLEIREITTGTYDAAFILPVLEGRSLRAEPRLPPTCRDMGERKVSAMATCVTTTWTFRSDPSSLAGEAILVEGLLGTQVELAFTLTTLDGRVYSEILRPSRPGFLVPEPPSLSALAAEAGVAGLRRTLRQAPLWLFVIVVVLLGARARAGARARELLAVAAAFSVAHGLGQWLGVHLWFEVAPMARDAFTLLTVALPAVALAGAGERWRGWLRPAWPAAAAIGLLAGGASPESMPSAGLSYVEQAFTPALFAAGSALALLLMALAAVELEAVLRLARGGRWRAGGIRGLGYVMGAAAVGLLLTELVGVAVRPAVGRAVPPELFLLAALLGPTLAAAGRGGTRSLPIFAGLAALGVAAGILRLQLPVGGTLAVGSLLLLGAALAVNRPLAGRWLPGLVALAVPASAWFVTHTLVENVSRSTGAAVGTVVLATCVLFAGLAIARGPRAGALPAWMRWLGAAIALYAIWTRAGEYIAWFDGQLATEAALGLVRLPLLALLLVVVALVVRPRRRRVLSQLGVERRPRVAHRLLIGAAFLALPYGTVALRNPLHERRAPRGEDARRVAARVLSDTYQAFNLEDEDELYDSLARSVTDELIDDLYLDSRRRLTAGTREGAQVTVRDVSVLEIGPPEEGANDEEGLAYGCRWVVTARVQHLQHVHHRRNVYSGVLTLRIDGDRWKIARVELRSEEREVIPWKPA